jgi:hypothetical protein
MIRQLLQNGCIKQAPLVKSWGLNVPQIGNHLLLLIILFYKNKSVYYYSPIIIMFNQSNQPNCPSRFLNQRTGLRDDSCEKTWRDRSNELMSNYWLSFPPGYDVNQGYLCEPGLNSQTAPLLGERACDSSELRNGCLGNLITHTGARRQLAVRPFRTVPHMGSCRVPMMDADTYSMLVSGESTRTGKGCDSLSGINIDRFEPLVPCLKYNIQNPDHYIPKYWVRGGMDTRAYIRNTDYLKACGIKKCVTPCEKAFCGPQNISSKIALSRGQTANLPCFPNSCVINSRC